MNEWNEWHNDIVSAIKNMEVVTISYDNEECFIEPYAYGLSTRGDDILRAYQTSGIDPGWRVFRVDQIAFLIHAGYTFAGARGGYERNDPGIKEFYWRLP